MLPSIAARELIDQVGIKSFPIRPLDLCQILKIQYHEEDVEGFIGSLIIANGNAAIIVKKSIKEQGRKNFTAAHEIGHFKLHLGHGKNIWQCTDENINSFSSKRMYPEEIEANEFAAELLMPEQLFKEISKKKGIGWDSIKELAKVCETSLTATAKRFISFSNEACALVVSENGNVKYFQPSSDFGAYIGVGPLLKSTLAYHAFQGKNPNDEFITLKAMDWVSGRRIDQYKEILEWSLPINSYGQVLTLLLDEEGSLSDQSEDEEIEDDEEDLSEPTFHKSKRKS